MLELTDVGNAPTVDLYGVHAGNCFNWATGLTNINGSQLCTNLATYAQGLGPGNVGQQVFDRLLQLCPGNHLIILDHTRQGYAQQSPDRYYMCVLMIADNIQMPNGREVHFARLCSEGFYGRPAAGVPYLTRCLFEGDPNDEVFWMSHQQYSQFMTHYVYGYYMFFVKQQPVVVPRPKVKKPSNLGQLNSRFKKGDGGGESGGGGGGMFLVV